jgi:single-stranded DNA-binding protein
LKVVAWNNLAKEVQESYQEGDSLVIEGRLNMAMIERAEGFKEKRAELVASRIHRLSGATASVPRATSSGNYAPPAWDSSEVKAEPPLNTDPLGETNLDEIPF